MGARVSFYIAVVMIDYMYEISATSLHCEIPVSAIHNVSEGLTFSRNINSFVEYLSALSGSRHMEQQCSLHQL